MDNRQISWVQKNQVQEGGSQFVFVIQHAVSFTLHVCSQLIASYLHVPFEMHQFRFKEVMSGVLQGCIGPIVIMVSVELNFARSGIILV